MVIFSIIALCIGLIVGTLVGYYIATTSTSARLVAISTMKEELPTLDDNIRIGWENTAHDFKSIEMRMLEDCDMFEILLIDEDEFKRKLMRLASLKPRTNCEDIIGLMQIFTKVEISFLATDLAQKVRSLHTEIHTHHAN